MSESLKIALTAVVGIAVFVAGQLIQKLFIEPIQDRRKAMGEILYVIDYYSSLREEEFNEDIEKAARKYLRRATSDLYRFMSIIPAYRFLSTVRIVPKKTTIEALAGSVAELTRKIDHKSLEKHHAAIKKELRMIAQ
jgi:hypothetical protein